jgi:hypothetical protein
LELADQTVDILNNKVRHDVVPVLGLLRVRDEAGRRDQRAGRVVVFGDSSCLDNANKKVPCFPLVDKVLGFASDNTIEEAISAQAFVLEAPHQFEKLRPPERIPDSDLGRYSKVLNLPEVTPCSQLTFKRANNSELREIFWPPVIFTSSFEGEASGGITPGRRKTTEGEGMVSNKDKGGDVLQVGYGYAAIPYGLFFLGMFFVVILALRPRTEQPQSSSQSSSSTSSSSSQSPSVQQQSPGYSQYSYPAYSKSSNV